MQGARKTSGSAKDQGLPLKVRHSERASASSCHMCQDVSMFRGSSFDRLGGFTFYANLQGRFYTWSLSDPKGTGYDPFFGGQKETLESTRNRQLSSYGSKGTDHISACRSLTQRTPRDAPDQQREERVFLLPNYTGFKLSQHPS